MFLTKPNQLEKYSPLIIASIIAIVALLYYIFSGQGSLNLSTRTLQNSDPQVDSVKIIEQSNGQKNAEVKCKDSSTYEVYYPPGENNYDALSASKCLNQ